MKQRLGEESMESGGGKEVVVRDIGPLLRFFSVILVLRGLVNLLSPILWGVPFDEFFLGSYAVVVLNLLFIISGMGVFLGRDWGYFIALPVCVVAFVLQSDANIHEKTGGEIMSLFLLIGFWNGWKRKKGRKTPKGKVIALAAILLLTLAIAYDSTQPTKEQKYDYYSELAKKNKDPTICKKIGWTSGTNQCIRYVAVNTKNISSCDLIKTPESRERCYTEVSRRL